MIARSRIAQHPDRGGIVIGWLIKIVVATAIVGVVLYEAGAIVVTHVGADTAANDASGEAAFVVARGGSDADARVAAQAAAAKAGAKLTAFAVSRDGKTVTLTVEKRAHTLLVHRLGFMRSWGIARTTRRRAVVA